MAIGMSLSSRKSYNSQRPKNYRPGLMHLEMFGWQRLLFQLWTARIWSPKSKNGTGTRMFLQRLIMIQCGIASKTGQKNWLPPSSPRQLRLVVGKMIQQPELWQVWCSLRPQAIYLPKKNETHGPDQFGRTTCGLPALKPSPIYSAHSTSS